jgi:aminopeptidase N
MFSSKQSIAITAGLALGAVASSYLLYSYRKVSSSTEKLKNTQDCSSLSNLDEFTTRNVHLDLVLDFQAKKVLGNAIYDLESLKNDLKEIDLDVKALKIFEVFVDGEKVNFKIRVVPKKEELGQQLNVINTNIKDFSLLTPQ